MSHLSGQFIRVSEPVPHVLLVELLREPVNAFNEELWKEYGQVFAKIALLVDVRVVVLASGLKKLFNAGIDLSSLSSMGGKSKDSGRNALDIRQSILGIQQAMSAPELCPFPVIAAIHGVAYGLAIDLLSAVDVRYAASDAMFSIKEVDLALAADVGTLARFPKITGNESAVRELAFTAQTFDAKEAEKIGFVSKVVDGSRDEVLAAALELAKKIAEKSPIALIGTKQLLLHARDHSVAQSLDYTAVWNSAMLQTSDLAEAFRAFQSKSKPTYAPLIRTKL